MFGLGKKEKSLEGKHAFVTGAGRGIGACIAKALAEEGARLTLLGRNLDSLRSTADTILSTTRVNTLCTQCDVSNADQVAAAFEEGLAKFGACDILINNAGVADSKPLVKTEDQLWQQMIDVNLKGTFLCTRAALPAMLESKHGRIVNIASTAGLKGYAYVSAYCAAKHGVVGLTRSLAAEVVKQGVTVNAICPGFTETDLLSGAVREVAEKSNKSEAEIRAEFLSNIPQGRFVEPSEVASAAVWLCHDKQSSITGQTLVIAGGESI